MFLSKQLTLNDIYEGCLDSFENDKPAFLSMLEEHIDIQALIPYSFKERFYRRTGRPREYPLHAFIWALILQDIFSIPSDSLLILFLRYSREIREFCGFDKVPDAAKFTRFKQDFVDELKDMFENLVELTEPVCQEVDASLASMTVFDTTGIEAYVRENNPKYINALIKRLKTWKAANSVSGNYDPYKMAYGMMPPHAGSEPDVKQMYINGHFCYAHKFGLIANGMGIVRDITFYNKDFLKTHPEIEIGKKSGSPDEDKSLADSKALIPTLKDFFKRHPAIKPNVFIGDSAFDTVDIYAHLLGDGGLGFNKAFIPLNDRSSPSYPDCTLNEEGVPCCPKDPSLPMKPESGKSHLRCGRQTFKFVCPKMKWVSCDDGKSRRRTSCDEPCTDSLCGRMVYVYPEKNLRSFPGTVRGTEQWDEVYKIRVSIEKSIGHFKENFCVAGRRTRDASTLYADLLLAGITQQITVLLANSIHKRQYLRSLKPLIAA
jgi:hypothetical protein